MKPADTPIW